MCDLVVNGNQCSATNEICPYMYYCNTYRTWKPSKNMPDKCNVRRKAKAPEGFSPVRMVRKGKLYIDIDDQTYIFDNPFDYIPDYVKVYKTKTGWKIRRR